MDNNKPLRLIPKPFSKNGCVLFPQQYNILWRTSWLAFFNCIHAIINKHYDVALVPGGVFLTSINYWRKPDYSWRRYIDISYVSLSLFYQSLRAYNAQHSRLYYVLIGLGILNYHIGVYHYKKKRYWTSIYYHVALHITMATSNYVLYSGTIGSICTTPLISYFYIKKQ